MRKLLLCLALVGLGLLVGTFVPPVSDSIRHIAGMALPPAPTGGKGHGHAHGHGDGDHAAGEKEGSEGHILMTAEQIGRAKVEIVEVGGGTLARRLTVPGTVTTDADRVARIAGKVVGTVAEMRKRLGEPVAKGEVVAVLDSREVAEARSEFFAATTNLDLQQTLFEREQTLWDKRISAEQQFLRARQTFTEAHLRVELASQKLQALGFSEADVADLARRFGPVQTASAGSNAPVRRTVSGLQKYEIRSPIAGRVIERNVDLGAPIGGESEAKELYVLADLSSVWIDLAVPSGDVAAIREGLEVVISAGAGSEAHKGKIGFVSPVLNQETRSARVIASVENKDMTWRPGSYVTAQVTVSEEPVDMKVPRTALQAIGGEQIVFVRNEKGFEKREVVLGKGDDSSVEILFGLDPGEKIAATNSFVLKAELGKAEAEHVH